MERSILADNAESNSPRPLYRMSIISLLVLGSSYSVDAFLVIRSQFTGPDPNMSALQFFTLVSVISLLVLSLPSVYVLANWRFNPIGFAVALLGNGLLILLGFDEDLPLLVPLIISLLLYVNIQEFYGKRASRADTT